VDLPKILLHNKRHGYLHYKKSEELMVEMESLANLAPEDVPEASSFLIKINFTEISKSHIETQKYWSLAVNAALAAQNLKCLGVREPNKCLVKPMQGSPAGGNLV
jgi:hypothetical protein